MTLATLVLAVVLDPGGIITWLIVGLIAGFLASRVMRGKGYGLLGDIIIGIIGAFIGSFILDLLGIGSSYGILGTIVVSFLGACILIVILRAIRR